MEGEGEPWLTETEVASKHERPVAHEVSMFCVYSAQGRCVDQIGGFAW